MFEGFEGCFADASPDPDCDPDGEALKQRIYTYAPFKNTFFKLYVHGAVPVLICDWQKGASKEGALL